jgi:hypothetical protein
MHIDVSAHPEEVFDCPELPFGLSSDCCVLEVDGVEAPTAFAVDTDEGLVKWYKTEPGTFTIETDEQHNLIVMEKKYRTLTVHWDNNQGISGQLTFKGKV